MTTPTKTKNTKANKPVQKQTACIGLGQILEQYEHSFINIEEAVINIDELNEIIAIHNGEILELKNFIEHSINCIFWMTAIGIAVAITFSGVAIFR